MNKILFWNFKTHFSSIILCLLSYELCFGDYWLTANLCSNQSKIMTAKTWSKWSEVRLTWLHWMGRASLFCTTRQSWDDRTASKFYSFTTALMWNRAETPLGPLQSTPLHLAATEGWPQIVVCLIENGDMIFILQFCQNFRRVSKSPGFRPLDLAVNMKSTSTPLKVVLLIKVLQGVLIYNNNKRVSQHIKLNVTTD